MCQNVFLGAETMTSGHGGIARVARIMAKVIGEKIACGELQGQGLALSDSHSGTVHGLTVRGGRGSRLRFCFGVQKASWGCSHFLYDFLGMARAHRFLPGMRRPMLSYIHGIEVWENSSHWVQVARRADFLVANTAYTRDRAERLHGGFGRAKVCWLATESDELPPALAPSKNLPTVLILGRIDEGLYKWHRELIECWPKVVSAVPWSRLLVVGTGPKLDALKQMAAVSPVAHSIEFRGFVPEDSMNNVWAESNVLAMPSRGEGFGLVYIEAMRQGLPVVGSIHDAAPEINLDGQTGYNVNLDRPNELSERLIQLLRDRDHASFLGKQGQQRWREFFCYPAFQARFSPLLQEFLSL